MKQALSLVEQKLQKLDRDLVALKAAGVNADEEKKRLYSTEAAFRALFHSIDVEQIKSRSDEFIKQLEALEDSLRARFTEMRHRRNYSTILFLVFASLTAVTYLLSRKPGQ